MTVFQAIVLGLAQGLTEFLPVSSSAHLILIPWLFRWADPGLAFDVFLHSGTLLALVVYFFGDWMRLLQAGAASLLERKLGFDRNRSLFWLLVAASVPAAAAGVVLNDYAEGAFRSPLLVATLLALVGFLLFWVDGRATSLRTIDDVRFGDAMWIGVAQACALFPGVSRSGSTMTAARFLGFSRESAARFSFLLATPITFGAIIFKFGAVIRMAQSGQLEYSYLVAGFLTSFFSGLAAIHGLLGFVKQADFRIFAWYRLLLAAFIIIFSLASGR